MNKRLRKVLKIALIASMIIGMSAITSTELHADAARRVKTVKVNHHNNRRGKRAVRKSRRHVRNNKAKRKVVKRYQSKMNRMKRERGKKPKAKPKYKVYRSRFKRSNNRRALRRSYYYDAHIAGANIIFDRYAPNSKRAVVPKKAQITYWYQGKFGQKDPIPYYYVSAVHGWMRLK